MRKLTNKECCEIIKDLKSETYLALLRGEPKVSAEFAETFGAEGLRDILNLSETRNEEEVRDRQREEMYLFINNIMDRFSLTCPPIELFNDKTLERWFAEYQKIDDILEDLNDVHWGLLLEAEELEQQDNDD